MKVGDTVELVTYLSDNAGADLSYADLSAFTGAGWDLDFTIDQVPTVVIYTVTDLGDGFHSFKFTSVQGDYLILITGAGTNDSSVDFWQGSVDSVELSDVYNIVNSGSELTPITQSLGDQSLGNIIDGDAWASGSITVPMTRLSPYGLTDLTGCTIAASFRLDPSTTPVGITASIDDAANRVISAKFDTFPAEMALGATAADLSKTWYLDIAIEHTATTRKITVARYSVSVLWQRDET